MCTQLVTGSRQGHQTVAPALLNGRKWLPSTPVVTTSLQLPPTLDPQAHGTPPGTRTNHAELHETPRCSLTALCYAGGGSALLHAAKGLAAVRSKCDNFDQQIGVDIVQRAIQMPARTILRNAGLEGAVIIGKLIESDDINFGYDSAKDVYCDMVASGVPPSTPLRLGPCAAVCNQRLLRQGLA